MPDQSATNSTPLAGHGSAQLASVLVDTYNAELRDTEGFIGDRASKRAFQAIVDDWRERLRKVGEDPLGETPTDEIGKKKLDKLLVDGDAGGGGPGPRRDRGVRAGARRRHPPFSAPQGLARHAAHRGRRRLARQPHRRARDRPGRRAAQGRARPRGRAPADPPSPRRGRADRRDPSGARLDLLGPRQHPRRRYRRHQHPRRRRRAEPQEGARPVRGARDGLRAVAARRRQAEPRGRRSSGSATCSAT